MKECFISVTCLSVIFLIIAPQKKLVNQFFIDSTFGAGLPQTQMSCLP